MLVFRGALGAQVVTALIPILPWGDRGPHYDSVGPGGENFHFGILHPTINDIVCKIIY